MPKFLGALLCATAMLGFSGAVARAESATAATPPSARAKDCAVRYNAAMHVDQTMAAMMRALMPIMFGQMERTAGKTLTAEQRADMVEAMAESASIMGPRLQDELIPAMLQTFSEAEICAMAAFYESPEGQGVVTKMPAYTEAASGAMRAFLPEFQADMYARICRRMGCDPKKMPAAQPS